jgi:tripartite-type tricarboxylate transporter receptor subunit TctC
MCRPRRFPPDRARESAAGHANYGSIGVGSSFHLAGELFGMMAHVSIVHVPYRGEAPR